MAFSDWSDVESSHIDAVRFDAETGTMQVRYDNGATYEWYGVTDDQVGNLVSASSVGSYLRTAFGRGRKVL